MKKYAKSEIKPNVAVIIPCYNEELSIGSVVKDFKKVLPEASIYVFDNNSTDHSVDIASSAGATVIRVMSRGKGNVVRRMFADVDADVYLMCDGDATYDANSAPKLIDMLLTNNLDMVVGSRVDQGESLNYRPGHRVGNKWITASVKRIFGGNFTDMLSGYRAFSRRYVKSFPALATGFEIETELTVHALELRMPFEEVETAYGSRRPGSTSKLLTYRDGSKIIKTILRLYMTERPMEFFSIIAFICILLAVVLSAPIVLEFYKTGLVPRLPTAVLSVGLTLSGLLLFVCGIVLHTVTQGRHEVRRLAYLSIPKYSNA